MADPGIAVVFASLSSLGGVIDGRYLVVVVLVADNLDCFSRYR